MSGNLYIDILFDTDKPGFIDVSENILSYLDYKSFVRLKRSCRSFYNFINDRPYLEKSVIRRKLASDWRGDPVIKTFEVPGCVVSHAHLFDNGQSVGVAVNNEVRIFDIETGNCRLVLAGAHDAAVTCVEIVRLDSDDENDNEVSMYASGCREGVLALWSPSGQLLVRKQLFGRLMTVKWKGRWLATAHFGKPFDAGCISIREIHNCDEMPVVFALYEDLFPVVMLDFNEKFVAALEWIGTFSGIEAGNVFIYKWHEREPVADLSQMANCSFSTVRFSGTNRLVTGGHDKLIRWWKFVFDPTDDSVFLTCLHVIPAHNAIIVKLEVFEDRFVTRDLSGKIIVWDVRKIESSQNAENCSIVEFSTKGNLVSTVAINNRQLLIGQKNSFKVVDFWNSSKVDPPRVCPIAL